MQMPGKRDTWWDYILWGLRKLKGLLGYISETQITFNQEDATNYFNKPLINPDMQIAHYSLVLFNMWSGGAHPGGTRTKCRVFPNLGCFLVRRAPDIEDDGEFYWYVISVPWKQHVKFEVAYSKCILGEQVA